MCKILAVIPARAGSKGIPNKNIRHINGRRLIWYTIENAKKSSLITDIVVTSDSVPIKIIAKQMGVCYKERGAELCGDAVTLDAVIYDAAVGGGYDYVVTLQPTSPTLKTETLDNAITHAINNKLDTVISVINSPHLSWREENGKKTPNYVKRQNRQYLPANYIETGAFVITKGEWVTVDSRIGKNVDVYEISEEEAVDVDNFADLKNVETILTRKSVAIYVNGNNKRGTGHIYRVMEIANEFYTKPDIYYDVNQTDKKIFGDTTHNLIGVNGIGELLTIIEKKQYDIFINDILSTTIDYMIAVKSALPNAKIINFEDDGEGIIKADLVINDLYQHSDYKHVKSGELYYITPMLFMFYEPIEINDKVKNVFISFGGADPQNYSDRIINIIKKDKYNHLQFKIVLGRAKQNIDELMLFNQYSNITVYHDVSNMPEIMSGCDVGITSRGRTGYELAVLGIPSMAMAQNNREEKHGFIDEEHGFTYIGLNPEDELIEEHLDILVALSKKERQRRQETLLSNDLKNGRKRNMNLINNL